MFPRLLDSETQAEASEPPVPKIPRPVSNLQEPALTLPSAGSLKLSAQTCFHGGAGGAESPADEQPVMTRTGRTLSQAASRRSPREAPVRSALPLQRCPRGR